MKLSINILAAVNDNHYFMLADTYRVVIGSRHGSVLLRFVDSLLSSSILELSSN